LPCLKFCNVSIIFTDEGGSVSYHDRFDHADESSDFSGEELVINNAEDVEITYQENQSLVGDHLVSYLC
jgi:hypothetical protein